MTKTQKKKSSCHSYVAVQIQIIHIFQCVKSLPIYLKPEKGSTFGRSLPHIGHYREYSPTIGLKTFNHCSFGLTETYMEPILIDKYERN